MTENTPKTAPWTVEKRTAILVLADGTVIEGKGLGATGAIEAEVVFNTALTGYEEILTDPSYAGQIVTFTFPHIGNVGANAEDIEDLTPANRHGAVGAIFKADITSPSNFRATEDLDAWLKHRGIIALAGIDTRALTSLIRERARRTQSSRMIRAASSTSTRSRPALQRGAASKTSISPRTLRSDRASHGRKRHGRSQMAMANRKPRNIT
jgi:carbamoyl-phosphate synthase small subunit